MSSAKTPHIQMLAVAAIVDGQRATLLDRNGRTICMSVALSRVGPVNEEQILATYAWDTAAIRMAGALLARRKRNEADPWQRKADSLAKSFRLRSFDRAARGGRTRFEKYSTTTWPEAAKRLWQQAHNRVRRHDRGGWIRWAHTASGNGNKRADARYG